MSTPNMMCCNNVGIRPAGTNSAEICLWVLPVVIYVVPKVLEKLFEFTHDIMNHGYDLKIKVGSFDFALENGAAAS